MSQVIGAFLSTEGRQERSNRSANLCNRSRFGAPEELLEFAVSNLKKDQSGRVKQALLSNPTSARASHICSLGSMASELCSSFYQGQVRLTRNHRHYAFRLVFEWRNAAAARLRRDCCFRKLHPW